MIITDENGDILDENKKVFSDVTKSPNFFK